MTDEEARRVLHVGADCARDEVRRAYTDLVKVWHPDRFQSDPRLREKAEETLRLINAAYAVLQRTEPAGFGTPEPSVEREPSRPATGRDPASIVRPAPPTRIRRPGLWAAIVGSIAGVALVFAVIAWEPFGPHGSATAPALVTTADVELPGDRVASPADSDPGRPESGGDLAPAAGHGAGRFATRNGTRYDAVVLLDQGVDAERTFFVRSGEQVTFLDLLPGTYRLRVILGIGWTGRAFSRVAGHYEMPPATVVAPEGSLNVRPPVVVIDERSGLRPLPPFGLE